MAVEVFLVEDLVSMQNAVTQMLRSLGDFHIRAIHTTEAEALSWAENHAGEWDLALIDLVLEQGSGMSVISRCRRTSPQARVVVFSNFVTPGIRAHCIRLGADAAFDKNADLEAFTAYCAAIVEPGQGPAARP